MAATWSSDICSKLPHLHAGVAPCMRKCGNDHAITSEWGHTHVSQLSRSSTNANYTSAFISGTYCAVNYALYSLTAESRACIAASKSGSPKRCVLTVTSSLRQCFKSVSLPRLTCSNITFKLRGDDRPAKVRKRKRTLSGVHPPLKTQWISEVAKEELDIQLNAPKTSLNPEHVAVPPGSSKKRSRIVLRQGSPHIDSNRHPLCSYNFNGSANATWCCHDSVLTYTV